MQEYATLLKLFAEKIERETGVKAFVAPNLITPAEPHLLLFAEGWNFESLGLTPTLLTKSFTLLLKGTARLQGYGEGIEVFLPLMLEASFKLNKLLCYEGLTIKLTAAKIGGASMRAESKGGKISAESKEGKEFFSFVEDFEFEIRIPYIEPI